MTRCSACPRLHKCIPPDGAIPSRVMLIGEAPGKEEDKKGRVFIGKTGEEVMQHYLPLAGLRRDKVLITNAIKCLPASTDGKLKSSRPKDIELLETCFHHHVYDEIEQCQPSVIVPMGSFACRGIDPELQLDLHHGIPIETGFGTVFPMYHPAGGLYEPKKMLTIRNDWIRLGKYLRGKLKVATDQYPEVEYIDADEDQVEQDLAGNYEQVMANDTETVKGSAPYCLTYSLQVGTGRLIRAEDTRALARFQYHLSKWRGHLLWHNWLFDYHVVRKMGLRYPNKLIRDTMLMAFYLGNLPQGLKALSYRELGMKMQDFDDLVAPYSTSKVVNYYLECQSVKWPKPAHVLYRDKDGVEKTKKPHGFNTLLKIFFTHYTKNFDKDVFEAWANWSERHEEIERIIGPWPGKCLSHVPHEKVRYYACRDADALLRLYPILKRFTRNVRKVGQEHWGDYEPRSTQTRRLR